MAKEKKYMATVNWRKELRLAPGYVVLTLWILFTFMLLGWVLMASFSTTKEIFADQLLASGFHVENYVKAWVNSDVSGIFTHSLGYSVVSCSLLVVICAPARTHYQDLNFLQIKAYRPVWCRPWVFRW